jgi:hypothetical protein
MIAGDDVDQYGQTKWGSFWESLTNIVIGLVLAVLGNSIYFHLTGHGQGWTWEWMIGLGAWMTLLSLVRSYTLRRIYNRLHLRRLRRKHALQTLQKDDIH